VNTAGGKELRLILSRRQFQELSSTALRKPTKTEETISLGRIENPPREMIAGSSGAQRDVRESHGR